MDEKLCECGCGQSVTKNHRYIFGHHRKGKPHSEEAKKKISDGHIGRKQSEETIEKIRAGNIKTKNKKP